MVINKKFNREELLDKLMFLHPDSGFGFGLTEITNMMAWNNLTRYPDQPDWKSVVAICNTPDQYTDEELSIFVEISEAVTAKYDDMFRFRIGANLLVIGKPYTGITKYMYKKLTWHNPAWANDLNDLKAKTIRG